MALSNTEIELIVGGVAVIVFVIILAIVILLVYNRSRKDTRKILIASQDDDLLNKAAEKDAREQTKKIVFVQEKRPYVVGYGKKQEYKTVVQEDSYNGYVV
jgi:hypothetical protein